MVNPSRMRAAAATTPEGVCPNRHLATWEPHRCGPDYCEIDEWPLIKAEPHLFGAPDLGDFGTWLHAWHDHDKDPPITGRKRPNNRWF